MVLYLLNLRKNSAQIELDQFFKHIENRECPLQSVTKSAFFQARTQLSHTAFIELNQIAVEDFYGQYKNYQTWNGFRLCAIDGSQIRLPNEADVVTEFGTLKGKENQGDCPLALASIYYDVLNHIAIDASLNPTAASERACAVRHLAHARKDDLVLYDRGYNAFWLYAYHVTHNIAFCMRAKVNRGLLFKHFVDSGKHQAVITLEPNKQSIEQCQKRNLPDKPIKLRLIRVDLPGEVEVLITNLMDETTYEVEQFKALYHFRWGTEENYKRLKQWVEIENFSGKSALSVKQDFHSKIFTANLTALMALAAQKRVHTNTKNCRNHYKINFAQALSKMKHTVVSLILHCAEGASELIQEIINYIALTIEPVRKGRSYKRKSSKQDRRYFICYKRAL